VKFLLYNNEGKVRRALRSPKADVTLEKITSSILGGGM